MRMPNPKPRRGNMIIAKNVTMYLIPTQNGWQDYKMTANSMLK